MHKKEKLMKKYVHHFFKITLAILIIYWLLQKGKLDPQMALDLFLNSPVLIPALILSLLQIFITSHRWKILLQVRSTRLNKPMEIFLIQWIGQLFSSALPGVVTGDLIKLSYVKKIDDNLSKKFLLLTVFLDRLIGLFGLLLVSGISSLIFYKHLISLSEEMYKVILVNFSLLICSLLGIGLFFLPHALIDSIKKIIKIKKISDTLELFKSFRINKTTLTKLIILSSLTHILGIIVFHIINLNFYETSIKIQDLMTIIPIGQIAVAIPISPAGLGVGHLAYQKLFSFINIKNGATLFNNFWILCLFVNLIGVIPYLFIKYANHNSK